MNSTLASSAVDREIGFLQYLLWIDIFIYIWHKWIWMGDAISQGQYYFFITIKSNYDGINKVIIQETSYVTYVIKLSVS